MNEANHNLEALTDKLEKADEIIDKLGNENNTLRRDLSRAKETSTQEKSSYGNNGYGGSNVYSGGSFTAGKVDRTEVNRLENEVRNLKDQLGDKQQRIRELEDEISRRPTKEVLR